MKVTFYNSNLVFSNHEQLSDNYFDTAHAIAFNSSTANTDDYTIEKAHFNSSNVMQALASGGYVSSFIPVQAGDKLYFTGKYGRNYGIPAVLGYSQKDSSVENLVGVMLSYDDLDEGSTTFVNKPVIVPSGVTYVRAWSKPASSGFSPSIVKVVTE